MMDSEKQYYYATSRFSTDNSYINSETYSAFLVFFILTFKKDPTI